MGNVIQATSQISSMGVTRSSSTTTPDLSGYLTVSQANQTYYTKPDSDTRYYTKDQSDSQYLTPTTGDVRYYTKQQSDSRYLTSSLGDSRYALASSALQLDNPSSITPSIPLGSGISNPAKSPTVLFATRPNLIDGYYWYFAGLTDYQYINGVKQYDPMFSPVRLYTRFNMVDGKHWVRVFSAPSVNPANPVSVNPTENFVGYNIPMVGFLMQQQNGSNQNYSYLPGSVARPFNFITTSNVQTLSVGGNKPGFKISVGAAMGHGFYISSWTSSFTVGSIASMQANGPTVGSCIGTTQLPSVSAGTGGRFPNVMVWGIGNSTTTPTYTLSEPGTVWETWITW